jgi:predicted nucleic acid-binding protein
MRRERREGRLRRCCVDTSAYFALTNDHDASHPVARSLLTRLADHQTHLFTTNDVIAETHALLNRLNRSIARAFLEQLYEHSSTTIVRVSVRDEQRARQIIATYTDKDFTSTDATSFAVMERLRIRHAFAFDDDSRQYGFTTLTPELLAS